MGSIAISPYCHYPDLYLQILKDFIYNGQGLRIGEHGLGIIEKKKYRIQNILYSVF